jgi:hypothetical protein
MQEEKNNKENLSEKILKEIDFNKICPTPKWCFVCKNYGSWFVVILSGVVISLSLSLMAFLFLSHDWDVYQLESGSLARHILVYTPFIWIIIFLLFILLASFWFNKTKEGYRFGFFKSLTIGVLVVIILSSTAIISGVSSQLNDEFRSEIPVYKAFVHDKCDIWDEPEKGLLSGRVEEIKNNDEFILNDFNDNSWQVREENVKMIPPEFFIIKGGSIKMIGRLCESCGNNVFIVNTIKPW